MKNLNYRLLSFLLAGLLGAVLSDAVSAQNNYATALSELNFQAGGQQENLRNGSVLHGTFELQGNRYPGIVLNPSDPSLNDPALVGFLRLATVGIDNWTAARNACRSLGSGWDLPRFDRRHQIFASRTFPLSAGTIRAPFNRMEDVYAFWVRMFADDFDKSMRLDGANGNQFYILSMNQANSLRSSIYRRSDLTVRREAQGRVNIEPEFQTIGRLGSPLDAPSFIDGFAWLNDTRDESMFNFERDSGEQRLAALRRELVSNLPRYFRTMRNMSAADLEQMRALTNQAGAGGANALAAAGARQALAVKEAYDRFFAHFPAILREAERIYAGHSAAINAAAVQAENGNRLPLNQELDRAAQSFERFVNSLTGTGGRPSWRQALGYEQQWRLYAAEFYPQMSALFSEISRNHQSKIALYCMKEVARSGNNSELAAWRTQMLGQRLDAIIAGAAAPAAVIAPSTVAPAAAAPVASAAPQAAQPPQITIDTSPAGRRLTAVTPGQANPGPGPRWCEPMNSFVGVGQTCQTN